MAVLGLYKLVRSLDLMNTLTAVIFIDIAINIPFATFLMKNSISSVPIELEEAARIDGAGVWDRCILYRKEKKMLFYRKYIAISVSFLQTGLVCFQ